LKRGEIKKIKIQGLGKDGNKLKNPRQLSVITQCITLVYTELQKPLKIAFIAFELFRLSFFPFSFIGKTVGSLNTSTTDRKTSNTYACTYVFILFLQNAYFCPSNCGIAFLYILFLSMIYL
jgi:hypothetical protein